MLIGFLVFIILLLVAYSAFVSFHAYRWARVIFILEDKYSEALEVHERTLVTFDKILTMQMFFDSPSVKQIVMEVMEDVKDCKNATQSIAYTLTQHSKKKYILEKENE